MNVNLAKLVVNSLAVVGASALVKTYQSTKDAKTADVTNLSDRSRNATGTNR